ncbi:helix-turn-helix transcriptional regulator [bacterium]|nr:helix-turn-helix transcriptional regulator [bacterium]
MNLSPKELKVLTLVAEGMSDKEIGVELEISERTVQTHLTRIMLKLQAKNRVNAAVLFFTKNPDLYNTNLSK